MEKLKLVIAEDKEIMTIALQEHLNKFNEFEVIYTARDGKVLLDRIRSQANTLPDIILMDVQMPELNGIQATEIISKEFPSVKIAALSDYREEYYVLSMFRAGARAFLDKGGTYLEFKEGLHILAKTGYYIPEKMVEPFKKAFAKVPQIKTINENEKIFLKYLCQELTYKEIADKMCVSERAVNRYRENLFDKLKVVSRTGLAMYAMKTRIVPFDFEPF